MNTIVNEIANIVGTIKISNDLNENNIVKEEKAILSHPKKLGMTSKKGHRLQSLHKQNSTSGSEDDFADF